MKVGGVRDKQLHEFILLRIEQALNGRTWAWLARKSGVPRSTLMTQSATPHFSLDVLASVAHSLGRPIGYFFPQGLSADEAGRSAQDLLDHVRTMIAPDEAG